MTTPQAVIEKLKRRILLEYVRGLFCAAGNVELLNVSLDFKFDSVLDVGCGLGGASTLFALSGRRVQALNVGSRYAEVRGPLFDALDVPLLDASFEAFEGNEAYDAIWMSHVLEHMFDPGTALRKAHGLLKESGWLFLMVPPFKHKVVRDHVNTGWNVGQLIHVLLLCGFDVRAGHFVKHKYNVAAFVPKGRCSNPVGRLLAEGAVPEQITPVIFDPDRLAEFWPDAVIRAMDEQGSFNGNLQAINWPWDMQSVGLGSLLDRMEIEPHVLERVLSVLPA